MQIKANPALQECVIRYLPTEFEVNFISLFLFAVYRVRVPYIRGYSSANEIIRLLNPRVPVSWPRGRVWN